MPDARTASSPDPQEALDTNRHARHIVAGFAHATPALADLWQQIDHSLSDVPILTSEVTRLNDVLGAVWLDRANLAAAGRASLAASQDDELDPLSYLRDELTAQGFLTEDTATVDYQDRLQQRGRG